jgi:transcriptional regulator with XRE-family HTH domain
LRIKEIAQEKGLNMSQLSRQTGVDFTTIKTMFRNPHYNARIMTLVRIAEGVGVDLCTLFEQETD